MAENITCFCLGMFFWYSKKVLDILMSCHVVQSISAHARMTEDEPGDEKIEKHQRGSRNWVGVEKIPFLIVLS